MWAGQALQTKRIENGITQRRLAIALDVTEATIRNWERGRHVPTLTPRQTYTICEMLHLSLKEFASFEEVTNRQVEVRNVAHRRPRQPTQKADLISC
jgi:transcriptional regulator with XRE-family HTH domain